MFMVTDEHESVETFVCHPLSHPERPLEIMAADEIGSPEVEGYGVLDTGATETVSGLAALEWIMRKRHMSGSDTDGFQVVDVPNKVFKFGNGMTQKSESMILSPQRLGNHRLSLGIYTLEAQGVPVLVGIRTLTKLGALIDCGRSAMVLTTIDASLLVPLRKSSSGHLVMDLSHDWLSEGTHILFTTDPAPTKSEEYMCSQPPSPSCFMIHEFEQSSHAATSSLSDLLDDFEFDMYKSLHGMLQMSF